MAKKDETFWVSVDGERKTSTMGAQSAANYAARVIKDDPSKRVIVYDLGGAPIDYNPADGTVGYPDDTYDPVEEWRYIAKAMTNALVSVEKV